MINKIIYYINSQGRFHSSTELIENAFWFTFNSYISLINPTIQYRDKLIPVNYFGISIARSGSGKSFVYGKCKELFDIHKWDQAIKISYEKANKELDNNEIYIEGEKYNLKNFLPSFENTIEGTKEGLYLRTLSLSKCFSGSLNLINEEIMDIIQNSNLNAMKELYDGIFLGKVIKGSINENVYGIKSNMLIFGSSIGLKKDEKVYNYFQKALNSGIYRRSFIYYEEPKNLTINELEPVDRVNLDYIDDMIIQNRNSYLKGFPTIIKIDDNTYKLLDEINYELLSFSNEYIEDERFSAEIGSFDKILKLSALHTLLNNKYVIEPVDVEYAYNMYKRFRETNKTLFNVEPQHKRIYKVIKKLGKCTKSDILEQDLFSRMSFNEDMKLVEEYCYKNNERLVTTGSKIKFYNINPLEKSNINKIIISIPLNDRKEKTTQYKSMLLPLFGKKGSIESLVLSNVSNFCLTHFKDGKRSESNALGKINCIGIDIDNGDLNEIKDKLDDSNLTYLIYTTRNHQKEKDGFISDRFRILLPLSTIVEIEPDRHPIFVENICLSLGIEVFDTNALDISRSWFTNKEGIIYKNEGILFNPLPFLPDTVIDSKINYITEPVSDDEETNRRINGMVRYTLSSTGSGNRNNNLMRLCFFVYDLTNNKDLAKQIVLETNSMLTEPLNENELNGSIFKSLQRR